MPLYTFRCKACGQTTQAALGFHAPRPAACPCGGSLVRVFDAPNVVYRGSGFYSTDKPLYDPIAPEDLDD